MKANRSLDLAVVGGFSAILLAVIVAEMLPGAEALEQERGGLFYAIVVVANVINLSLASFLGSGQLTDLRKLSGILVLMYALLIAWLVQQTAGASIGYQLLFVIPLLIAALYHDFGGAFWAGVMVACLWSSAMLAAAPAAPMPLATPSQLWIGNAGWMVVALVIGHLLRAEHREHVHDREVLDMVREHATVLRSLIDAGVSLAALDDLEELLHRLVDSACQILHAEAASLVLINEQTGELEVRAAAGSKVARIIGMRLPAGTGFAGWVIANEKPLRVADAASDDRFHAAVDQLTGFETRSVLCVPLKKGARLFGALEVLNRENGAAFTAADLDLCTAYAAHAAVALAHAAALTEA